MINLLPDEIKKERKREKYKKIALLVMIPLFFILLGTNNYIERLAADYKMRLEKLNRGLTELKTSEKVIANKLEARERVEQQSNLVDDLENDMNYNWLINDLQLIIPQQVQLQELTITQNNQLLVTAKAKTNQQLLKTVQRLEKYPYFEGVRTESNQEQNEELYFRIKGQVRKKL
ncbi:MAG: PilN domain-containing protein [Halanaerobacter sp.]